jgi:RNA polymerase sigma-70 factor (ECF subfamily)
MAHDLNPEPPGAVQSKTALFSQIYREHRQSIQNFIYYRTGDLSLAEDLTSEVFMKMVEQYETSFNKRKPVTPWLFAIARNLVIDHHRRSKIIDWQPLSEPIAANGYRTPAKQTETRLTEDCLVVAMEYLTDDQQQVILLKFLERKSNREIGIILGKTEGAIKSLQFRALATLQRALEKEPCYGN